MYIALLFYPIFLVFLLSTIVQSESAFIIYTYIQKLLFLMPQSFLGCAILKVIQNSKGGREREGRNKQTVSFQVGDDTSRKIEVQNIYRFRFLFSFSISLELLLPPYIGTFFPRSVWLSRCLVS